MTCARHNDQPLSARQFQRAKLAWLTSYCKACGRMQFVLRAPHVSQLEEQPKPLTA